MELLDKSLAAVQAIRRYQRALDILEGLIIAQMFELTKMNMSGTGYKLRKYIAKALQAHSKAVKSALTQFNWAGSALDEPYSCCVRDMRTFSQSPRNSFVFMHEEDLFLCWKEDVIREEGDEVLAHHIHQYHNERRHFDAVHLDQLVKLSKVPGFTAQLMPGAHGIPMPTMGIAFEADEEDEPEDDDDELVEMFATFSLYQRTG
ncbi:hypothetical protein C8J57DRAFT_1224062 [Mycena rebaudengoi]|nr:hypothetical protein C8J57DRAFT_1224062 [Mycena rebaudengoi]